MKLKPRPYQTAAKQSIFDYFAANDGNPVVAMPTGTGKSIVIADFIESALNWYPNQRIMMLTHVKELIEQNFEKLLSIWPTAPAGIYSAGIGRKDTNCKITFGGIGSVNKKAHIFGHQDLILIDECHLVSPNQSTMYNKFISDLKEINPYLKIIGLSATPYRLGLGSITDGGLFTDICLDLTSMREFNGLIEEGYLSTLVPKKTKSELDVSSVKLTGGEFNQHDLQEAVDKESITRAAILETIEWGETRNHWLIFATGIEHAEHIHEMMKEFGISSAVVHSKMSNEERKDAISGAKSGKYRALINNNVLTTGFDFPAIDLIVVLRPTSSPGLWVQILGRGTRPVYAPGYDLNTISGRLQAIENGPKQNCLVLDFAGNTRRLGPINDPVIPKKKGAKKGGCAPVRICQICSTYNHASLRFCTSCGVEFPRQVKIMEEASSAELLATDLPVVESFKVDKVVYRIHSKKDRPDAILVQYYCGLRLFKEYVCLEHGAFPAKKARDWWRERAWDLECPETTKEALSKIQDLRTPISIRVWLNKKYPEVMNSEFSQTGT